MGSDVLYHTTTIGDLRRILCSNVIAPVGEGRLRFTDVPDLATGELAVGILRLVFDDGGHRLEPAASGVFVAPVGHSVTINAKDVIEVWVDDTGESGVGAAVRDVLGEFGFGDVAVRNAENRTVAARTPRFAGGWEEIPSPERHVGVKPNTAELLPLDSYDYVIVSFSGGKDSLACVLYLLELGVDPAKIELWHQSVDGNPWEDPGRFYMDWPCTPPYCEAVARALQIPLLYQWRDGGFEGEMLKDNARSQPTAYQNARGQVVPVPTTQQAAVATRRKFPQLTANMATRWCSSTLKIEPAAKAITNDARFRHGRKILFVTGERREESANRAKYAEVELYRADASRSGLRTAHQWRPIINWPEEKVWAIIRDHRLLPHPAYLLGWSRVSCMACIFGNDDQWASVRAIAPDLFGAIGAYERLFGYTIRRFGSVEQAAGRGREFVSDKPSALVSRAMSRAPWDQSVRLPDDVEWRYPAGAFQRQSGPT